MDSRKLELESDSSPNDLPSRAAAQDIQLLSSRSLKWKIYEGMAATGLRHAYAAINLVLADYPNTNWTPWCLSQTPNAAVPDLV